MFAVCGAIVLPIKSGMTYTFGGGALGSDENIKINFLKTICFSFQIIKII